MCVYVNKGTNIINVIQGWICLNIWADKLTKVTEYENGAWPILVDFSHYLMRLSNGVKRVYDRERELMEIDW